MSEIRKGAGNPAAKIIVWFGTEYTKGEFGKFCRANGISKETIEFEFENNPENCYKDYDDSHLKYDQLTCPHCGLVSGLNKKPSGFKRFHFDRCKKKIKENYED
jgi:DNA-directed RNA polymerase subunit RPC12/RpoP